MLGECKKYFGKAHWDAAAKEGYDALVYAKGLFVLLNTEGADPDKMRFAVKNIQIHENLMLEYLKMAKGR